MQHPIYLITHQFPYSYFICALTICVCGMSPARRSYAYIASPMPCIVQGLAGALLTADTAGVALGQAGRLSVLGCAMLATVLRMPKVGKRGHDSKRPHVMMTFARLPNNTQGCTRFHM